MLKNILELNSISKSFPGVQALKNVSLSIRQGEIHALVGQNGAGKSTIVKIIAGIYKPDQGQVKFKGVDIIDKYGFNIWESGIAFVYQELDLIESFTVTENISFGFEKVKFGVVQKNIEQQIAKEMLKKIDQEFIPINAPVSDLTSAQKQLVSIAKAMVRKPSLLVLDEPTARLSAEEIKQFFKILKSLKKSGISILYISHRLEEVFKISDRVTILRDGEKINTFDTKDISKEDLIKNMIGHEIKKLTTIPREIKEEVLIRVDRLSSPKEVKDVSFSLKKGEILGIVGAVGAGKTELVKCLLGEREIASGKIEIYGKKITPKHPSQLISQGIGNCPEDRKTEGLILKANIRENISLPNLKYFSKFGFLSINKEKDEAKRIVSQLNIQCHSSEQVVDTLSGGNQQKVVLAKWLLRPPAIIIMDEPTIGIDVGSKFEIYSLAKDLADKGTSILYITSDIDEILLVSDRFVVLYNGTSVAELLPFNTSTHEVLSCMTGGN